MLLQYASQRKETRRAENENCTYQHTREIFITDRHNSFRKELTLWCIQEFPPSTHSRLTI